MKIVYLQELGCGRGGGHGLDRSGTG